MYGYRKKYLNYEEYPSAPVSKLIPHWYEIKSCLNDSIKYTGPFIFTPFMKGDVVVDEDGQKYEVGNRVRENPKDNIIVVSKTIRWRCEPQ
jgi:hypothetical protein